MLRFYQACRVIPLRELLLAGALAGLVAAPAGAADKIVIRGSDTIGAKLMPQLAEEFAQQKQAEGVEISFEIAAEGSSQGIAAVIDGTADIGMSSREARDTEISRASARGVDMNEIVIAFDGLAVVINQRNYIENLDLVDVEKIFTGDRRYWSVFRGYPGQISIYTRNTASGTYVSFRKLAMSGRDYATASQKMAGNEQIAQEVAANRYGAGYVGLAYVEAPGLKVVTVNGMEPTHPDYPLNRPLHLYTDGEPTGRVKEFIDFILGPEGQTLVDKVRFIPVKPAS